MRLFLKNTVLLSTLLLLVLGVSNTFAQSLEILEKSDKITVSLSEWENKSHIKLKNLTNQPIQVMATSEFVTIQSGHEGAFCLGDPLGEGKCYPPKAGYTESTNSLTIPANGEISTNDYIALFYPNGVEGTSIMKFTIYLKGNFNDKVEYTTTFNVGTTSIDKELSNKVTISPNPSSDVINISGIEVSNVKITDINGKSVMSFNENITSIDIKNLTNGKYFLLINGNVLKEFTVSR